MESPDQIGEANFVQEQSTADETEQQEPVKKMPFLRRKKYDDPIKVGILSQRKASEGTEERKTPLPRKKKYEEPVEETWQPERIKAKKSSYI